MRHIQASSLRELPPLSALKDQFTQTKTLISPFVTVCLFSCFIFKSVHPLSYVCVCFLSLCFPSFLIFDSVHRVPLGFSCLPSSVLSFDSLCMYLSSVFSVCFVGSLRLLRSDFWFIRCISRRPSIKVLFCFETFSASALPSGHPPP